MSTPNALARLDRDVLAQSGVKYVFVLEGINDLGMLSRAENAQPEDHAALVRNMIAAYEQMNVNCMLVSVLAEDAIRPGCAGPKRDKVTRHGREKNGPHSREFPAIGPFSQVVAGVV